MGSYNRVAVNRCVALGFNPGDRRAFHKIVREQMTNNAQIVFRTKDRHSPINLIAAHKNYDF